MNLTEWHQVIMVRPRSLGINDNNTNGYTYQDDRIVRIMLLL